MRSCNSSPPLHRAAPSLLQQRLCGSSAPAGRCHVRSNAVREQKHFSDMEEAREYLHSQAGAGPISALLNFLSGNAFGQGKGGLHLGSIYRTWLQHQNQRWQARNHPQRPSAGAAAAAVAVAPHVVTNLACLMLISEHRVLTLADRFPQLLAMPAGDVAQRLLLLKQLLPDCDVARMVELQPRLLLGCEECYFGDVIQPRLERLTLGLPGANIANMVQEDPALLFEDLDSSLPRLLELWPVDAAALAASDPAELALALRALSDKGPPRRY